METSTYQSLKIVISNVIDLSKDAIHIHIGLVVFFMAAVLWKKGRIEFICLLPVIIIAALMELLDLHDDFIALGYMRWSASLHDIINTLFWPIIIVVLYRKGKINKDL